MKLQLVGWLMIVAGLINAGLVVVRSWRFRFQNPTLTETQIMIWNWSVSTGFDWFMVAVTIVGLVLTMCRERK